MKRGDKTPLPSLLVTQLLQLHTLSPTYSLTLTTLCDENSKLQRTLDCVTHTHGYPHTPNTHSHTRNTHTHTLTHTQTTITHILHTLIHAHASFCWRIREITVEFMLSFFFSSYYENPVLSYDIQHKSIII